MLSLHHLLQVRRLVELTEAQWPLLAPLLPAPRVRADGRGRPRGIRVMCWMVFSGFPGPAFRGQICRRAIPRQGFWWRPSRRSPATWKTEASSIRGSVSSTPPSRGRKRGSCVGPTRRGKGTKVRAVAGRAGPPIAVRIGKCSPSGGGDVREWRRAAMHRGCTGGAAVHAHGGRRGGTRTTSPSTRRCRGTARCSRINSTKPGHSTAATVSTRSDRACWRAQSLRVCQWRPGQPQ